MIMMMMMMMLMIAGIFTAPVSGLYSFFLTQMTADSNPHLWLSIRIDGDVLDRIYTEGQGQHDTHDQGASQVTKGPHRT